MQLVIKNSFFKIFFLILLIAIVYYFIFHFSIFPMKDVEVLRVNSPDGKIDVVYIQRDAGAMTTALHLVYIVASKQKSGKKNVAVFQGKRVYDLKIIWDDDQKLLIQYSKAQICHFQNYIYPFPNDTSYMIEVQEMQVVTQSGDKQ